MSFKFTFREITPEDTEILRILKLRNAKPEEHICCEILRGDGMIAFSSFGGNTKDSISIEVCYIINTRPYDPYGYAKPDINTQPLFYSLRDNEIYLDIGNEGKINNTFEIVCQWMDKLLIPKMNELCATE